MRSGRLFGGPLMNPTGVILRSGPILVLSTRMSSCAQGVASGEKRRASLSPFESQEMS